MADFDARGGGGAPLSFIPSSFDGGAAHPSYGASAGGAYGGSSYGAPLRRAGAVPSLRGPRVGRGHLQRRLCCACPFTARLCPPSPPWSPGVGGGAYGVQPSFEDEPPLLEGALGGRLGASQSLPGGAQRRRRASGAQVMPSRPLLLQSWE